MDILREAAEQVKQRLYPDQGAKPEKKGEELAGFVKDTQAAAGAPAGPPAGPEEHEQQVGSKEGLSDKVEALAEDARSKVGPVSHGIRVPSLESMTSRDVNAPVEAAKTAPQAPSEGTTAAPEAPEQAMPAPAAPGDALPASMAAGGQAPAVPEGSAAPAMADKGMMPEEGGAMVEEGVSGPAADKETGAMGPTSPRQTFEERTYQMTRGAETPDGSLEKLHLHHQQGEEYEGAALAGKTEPFAKPPHGAGASGADQDRPVKLTMGHDYKHETADQQQVTETETAGPAADTTPETGPVDASHMSLEAGGQTTETTGTTIGEPVTGVPIKEQETGFETTDAAEASHMSLEAGAETDITETKAGSTPTEMPARRQMMPADQPVEVPEMLRDVVVDATGEEAESGPHAATTARLGSALKQDFESETNADAQGAESPDGKMEALHLHAEHGLEGPGSKADQQLGAVLQEGAPQPPPGAGASSSVQDPPDKMMPHRKEEAGVAGRAGATDLTNLTGTLEQQQEGQQEGQQQAQQMKGAATETTGTQGLETSGMEASSVEAGEGSGSAAGMVPHQKDLEAETNMEAKGAETPDGPLEALHLHAEHGLEGPGSKADQQLGAVLKEGAPQPPPGAGATTSAQDPPDKMMWHHKEEAGMGGAGNAAAETATGTEGQTTAATQEMQGAPSGMATFQEEPDFQREPSVTGTPTEDTSATAAETAAPGTADPEAGAETAGVGELGDGHVLKEEGVKKLAEAMAEVTGAGSPAEVLLRGEQKSEEVQKSERMREEGHKDPYVPEDGEKVEQAAVDSTSAAGGGMPAPQMAHDMAPEGTQAASTTAAHEATAGVGAYSRAAEGEMQGQQAGAGDEPKSGTVAPVSTSGDTAGMGMGGGYFAPGKGGSATTEAAHEGYIADPSASLPAHKTRVPVEVKHPGDPGVEPSGTGEPPHTTTGGTVFDLGTIKDAQVDHNTATKDFPENLAAP